MNFNEVLKRQREKVGLSQEEAAERLCLSLRAYKDRENDRANINIPERCGLLVGLGMSFDEAVNISSQPGVYNMGDVIKSDYLAQRAEDPFVRETEESFVIVSREHDDFEYTIMKTRVKTAEDILGWIDHVGEKTWITNEHLAMFVVLASHYLGLHIHPVS